VNSFVSLARQGYFDRTPCHRLTTQGYYVLQCGDPMGTGQGGPGYTFGDELVQNDPRLQPCGNAQGQAFCTYNTGTVAMANRGPDTNGSQFFLVYGNSRFPPDYTVFGHLDAAGLKVIKAIAAKGVAGSSGMGPGDGAPKEPVTITSVK
jgi:peptidyl-prolyl cis-trans isomerase B (cyclophilin B)